MPTADLAPLGDRQASQHPRTGVGNTRRLLVEPAGEIAQQSLGFVRIIELPGLSQRSADRRVQRLWQPLFHVAGLMNLAPLDRRGAEGPTDDLAQRLGPSTMNSRQTLRSNELPCAVCAPASMRRQPLVLK